MGKIRIKTLGIEELEKKQKEEAKLRRELKKEKGKKKEKLTKTIEEGTKPEEVKAFAGKERIEETEKEKKDEKKYRQKTLKKIRRRSKKYLKAYNAINKDKLYSLEESLEILKKISYAKFDESVELHLVTREKGIKGEVTFPHAFGRELKIAIADDKIIKELDSGKISFDILIAEHSYMPRLVKYAKLLGPKGLMPNPKRGTLTDKPKEAAEKFKSTTQFATEPKFPLIHQVVGKLSQGEKKILENIRAFIVAIGKSKIEKAFIKTTMSPSLKIDLETI